MVLRSKRKCMKYIATSTALTIASATMPPASTSSEWCGKTAQPTSAIVRPRSHQKMAM